MWSKLLPIWLAIMVRCIVAQIYYTYNSTRVGYQEAKVMCELQGRTLLTPATWDERNQLEDFLNFQNIDSSWIGLRLPNTSSNPKDFLWEDGRPLEWIDWDPGEPKNLDTDKCVVVKWHRCFTQKCDDKYSYICQTTVASTAYTYNSNKVGYQEAKDVCEEKGWTLVTPSTEEEHLQMTDFLESDDTHWIGLRLPNTSSNRNDFLWEGKRPLVWENWGYSYEPNDLETDKCVVAEWSGQYTPLGFMWFTRSCDQKRSYICQTTNTTAANTFYTYNNTRVGYQEAKYVCEENGWTLVTPSTEEEHLQMTEFIESMNTSWIGLRLPENSSNNNDFRWEYHSPRTWDNWDYSTREPDHLLTDKCVVVKSHNWDYVTYPENYDAYHHWSSRWFTESCDQKYAYICQSQTTPSVTQATLSQKQTTPTMQSTDASVQKETTPIRQSTLTIGQEKTTETPNLSSAIVQKETTTAVQSTVATGQEETTPTSKTSPTSATEETTTVRQSTLAIGQGETSPNPTPFRTVIVQEETTTAQRLTLTIGQGETSPTPTSSQACVQEGTKGRSIHVHGLRYTLQRGMTVDGECKQATLVRSLVECAAVCSKHVHCDIVRKSDGGRCELYSSTSSTLVPKSGSKLKDEGKTYLIEWISAEDEAS